MKLNPQIIVMSLAFTLGLYIAQKLRATIEVEKSTEEKI